LRWATLDGTLLPTPQEAAAQEQNRADEAQRQADEAQRRAEEAEGPRLTPADLELDVPELTDTVRTLKAAREAVEKDLILQALARNQGNVTHTAAELGVSRPTLHDLLTKLGISR